MRRPPHPLAAHVAEVYLAQRALGCDVTRGEGCTVARSHPTPLIYDANFAFDLAPEVAADRARFEACLDAAFDGSSHRKVVCHAADPPIVEARLAAAGFEVDQVVQMVLEGPLAARAGPPDGASLREVSGDAGWDALVGLVQANFDERNAKNGHPPYERAVAVQMVASWRAKPGMRFWTAETREGACAYLGSWSGRDGLGMVEYLFTTPAWRHRGIATALIAWAVEAVRGEGADAVLIGAEIEDTPKAMYLDLGFVPVCLTREWLRLAAPDPNA